MLIIGGMIMYEVILIDADGTLFDYNKAEKYALEETFAKNHAGDRASLRGFGKDCS